VHDIRSVLEWAEGPLRDLVRAHSHLLRLER